MTEEARAREGYAASKEPEYGTPWLLRFTNGQSTKIADFHYHDDCEFVARALNDYLAPQQRESWGALRFMLQEANDERDRAIALWEEASASQLRLAAENARLRAALMDLAGGPDGARRRLEHFWCFAEQWINWESTAPYFVPPHIVALQDAIYREGGE